MNNFELYKLKSAGLQNHHIINILNYQKIYKKQLSLRDMAVVAEISNPILFINAYKDLDILQLKKEFQAFSSISLLDKDYPTPLKSIYNAPVLLFYQGNIDLLTKNQIGIVGSRKASDTGLKTVNHLIPQLKNRFVITSGLARGIDTEAHFCAIRNKCQTIGVIGSGFHYYYPKENKRLQDYLAENYLVITEYGPNQPPLAHHFPERNRIIAGLSLGVIVIEAKLRSGSLITSQFALDEGREVFAVPGNILEGMSDGCNQLIKDGAKCITNGLDVLSEFNI